MFTRILFFIGLICLLSSPLLGQSGTLRGKITDSNSGEALMFSNIFVKELSTGTTSDLDGNYNLVLPEGSYTLEFSFVGYTSITVTAVKIMAGKDTEMDVQLSEGETLQEIVVTDVQIKNTEIANLILQKRSPGMLDGISTQAIKKTGDNDVGAAIRRVPGVSVEGGKHLIVRGLGDRYSKTILNGMDVPGLDPDRNSVQLDIFPTNLVDNIIVYKSFLPSLPGDFSGGLVNIITKDFPNTKTFSISAGSSYNPHMHFNSQYFFGFDDGNRELPLSKDTSIPNITENDPALTAITQQFNPTMATYRERSGLNLNGSVSYGDQINLSKFDLGYSLSANYRNETEYYDDFQFNALLKDPELDRNELVSDISAVGQLGTNNVLWSTLIGSAIKTDNHKISFSALHSQSAESRAAFINQKRIELGQFTIENHNLEYTERSVTNLLLAGKHTIGTGNFIVNWKLSPTFSKMSEPDIRLSAYETSNGLYELNRSTGGGVTRIWRSLDEVNYGGNLDLQYSFKAIRGLESKINAGFTATLKERDFEILDYIFPARKRGTIVFTGDPSELFSEELIWTPENDRGIYTEFNFEPSKTYHARQHIFAGYVMNELPVTRQLKFIYGLRLEKADNWYTGRRQNISNPDTDLFEDRKVLDELDWLPSTNIVYTIMEDTDTDKTMNLRASFSRTLARPTFKEKSIAQIDDRITGRTFIGNIDLEDTGIYNSDLRWEYFLPQGQLVCVSAFYKNFDKPIELTAFDATSPTNFIPRNVGNATVYGLELEMRKNLSFITPALKNYSFNINTTIVKSSVKMTEEEIAGRQSAARVGETIGDSRAMVGQSPILINAAINYTSSDNNWEGNVSFNTQGKRLSITGIGQVPDVYEKPFNSLNLRLSKRFGESKQWKASIGANNILDAKRKRVYQSYKASDEIFDLFTPGRNFSFSITYSL
jgi:outer membrane receptor for ferrienterochelin and colicin